MEERNMSVHINLRIFLFAVLFYFTKQIEMYAVLMIFALFHEMGHLACGMMLGLRPKSLKIMPFGLSIEFYTIPEDYNQKIGKSNQLAIKKIMIALAGPMTNFLVVGLVSMISLPICSEILTSIVYANFLIGFFNLLPIYPLDGGRIVEGILQIIKGKKVARKRVNQIANISMVGITAIASIVIYFYHNFAIFAIIVYMWCLVMRENKRYHIEERSYRIVEKMREKKIQVQGLETINSEFLKKA